jgi:predicted ribosomally synthesized peptide with nif11-like leader
MSQEDLQKFLEAVREDTSLQEKLKAEGADPVAIAGEAGLTITKGELVRAHASHLQALSDEELDAVAGGANPADLVKGLVMTVEGIETTVKGAALIDEGLNQ